MADNVITQDRRLCLLRSLNDCGGSGNESVLQDCVNLYGLNVSRDWVRTHLTWLSEQELVSLDDVCGVLVGTLTHRGHDLLNGYISVPGIKRARRV